GPLVVLIGPQSASAAEITAAAVLDNHRGLLVGRMTNGSVMESNYFPLPDGGTAQIPVNDFVRGHDRRIDSVGVSPDIWILPTLDDVRAGRDPALARALKEINGKELTLARLPVS
ncbi:MAG TPA: S41 family peptidase, partial [Steroidobacteraceae bacterium]|nr:S41 family peptidase [Steroidobacteraceae bacterium]